MTNYAPGVKGDYAVTNKMLRQVYWWMCFALAVTGMTAWFAATTPAVMNWLFSSGSVLLVLIIAEFALVTGLTAAIGKMSSVMATTMFVLYSVVNGLTLSSIFIIYEMGSVATAFFVTSGAFAVMALYGTFTKKDLTKLGSICMMALFGIIIALLVNLFMRNAVMDMLISGIAVLVFTGLIAYDSQKISNLLYGAEDNEMTAKVAVIGALTLYLDFINLFLHLLRFFGRRN
ncbi:MAG: Bax inhibitor-1/YccA family protein [Alistipes sp.]|nr:Bax inhibitor-1/YccA family protein [Candidatus Minthomonas equi]